MAREDNRTDVSCRPSAWDFDGAQHCNTSGSGHRRKVSGVLRALLLVKLVVNVRLQRLKLLVTLALNLPPAAGCQVVPEDY
jgi:hypothetical protein